MFVSDRTIIGLTLFCCLVSVALPVRSQDSPTAYIGSDIEGISRSLQQEPGNVGVRLRLVGAILNAVPDADVRQARKLMETAHEQMQRIRELEPGFRYPYRVISELQYRKKQYEQLVKTVDEFSKIGRPDHTMRKMYVKSLLHLSKDDAGAGKRRAAEYVGSWLDSGMAPPFGTTLGSLTAWLFDPEFRGDLLAMFERRHKDDPKNLNLLISYASCLYAVGRNESAWELVYEGEKIGLCDATTGARHQIVYLLEANCPEDPDPQRYSGTDREILSAKVEQYPDNMSLVFRYALLLKHRGFLLDRNALVSQKRLDLLLEKNPQDRSADKIQAGIKKMSQEAESFYSQALPYAMKVYEVNREIESLPLLLGDIHYRLKHHDQAIRYFEEGVGLLPQFAVLREGLSLVYKDLGRWKEASEQLLEVCRHVSLVASDWNHEPDNSLLPQPKKPHERMIVDILAEKGAGQVLLKIFTDAAQADPRNPRIPTYIAMAHYFTGNKAEACRWMLQAEKLGTAGSGGHEHFLATMIASRTDW